MFRDGNGGRGRTGEGRTISARVRMREMCPAAFFVSCTCCARSASRDIGVGVGARGGLYEGK